MQKVRRRIFEIVQTAEVGDKWSRLFDYFILVSIGISVVISFAITFRLSPAVASSCRICEIAIVLIFTVEYLLRLLTADFLFPKDGPIICRLHFILTPMGIVDLLAILPFYLPFLFPGSLSFLRLLRVVRLMRLSKIGRYVGAFHAISSIFVEKSKELFVSIMATLIMLVMASLLIFYAEHDAQPEVFKNAFSGLWWAVATLTTVGYGDIYPVTIAGKIFAALMALLGIGLVAVPTGILSGAYMEYLSRMKAEGSAPEEGGTYCPFCGKKLPNKHE